MVELLAAAMKLAVLGGTITRELQKGSLEVQRKVDNTLVTVADFQSQSVIVEGLVKETPGIPIIGEEGEITPGIWRKKWSRVWLIDPLDGTAEYIRGGADYSVNIALCVAGVPRLGVIYAPVSDDLFYGIVGWGAYRLRKTSTSSIKPGVGERLYRELLPARCQPVVAVSKSRLSISSQRVLSILSHTYGDLNIKRIGSAIKLGLIAAGEVDYYPRYGPTMEWDTAAGDALLRTVGGRIVQARTGRRLAYNKGCLRNAAFIAMGPGKSLPSGSFRLPSTL